MHEPSLPDPSPSSEDYQGHVECEHGGLTTNPSTRRRISLQVCFHHHRHHHLGPLGPDLGGIDSFWGKGYDILREIFPDWQTLSTETEPCAVCEAAMHIAREDKRGIKKQAEDEKVRGCTFSFFFLSFDRTCGWTCAHRTIIGKVETHLG